MLKFLLVSLFFSHLIETINFLKKLLFFFSNCPNWLSKTKKNRKESKYIKKGQSLATIKKRAFFPLVLTNRNKLSYIIII